MLSQVENLPPLKPLHSETSLSSVKLAKLEALSTDELKKSLLPGNRDCLKAKKDGTLLDGHHRISVLRSRGIDVDALPREILEGSQDLS